MKNIIFSRPLYLCGMMGSGKSTLGRKLSLKLSLPYHDLDDIIQNEAGMSIPEIFAEKSEPAFRELERKALMRMTNITSGIVSLGGGALQDQQITDHVKDQGWLVYLECDDRVLFNRLKNSANRPLLSGRDQKELQEKIQTLLEQRLPLYSQAHITIDSGKQSVDDTVQELIQKLTAYEQKYSG